MAMRRKIWCFGLCAAVVMLWMGTEMTEAVVYSPVKLNACLPAINMARPPSTSCCQKTKEQRPCFCGFLRDPNLKHFFFPLAMIEKLLMPAVFPILSAK
uniref:Bifunctional inhibitor/plant lipid transfer protein/seed storage helical domain-containing protein n=1 Tax=Manihot esculenta TaxID=3983 RepID=A0A2C9WBM1_MANES